MIFNMLQQKMAADGLSDAEFNALIKIGEGFGIIDEKSAAAAEAMNEFANSIVTGMDGATESTGVTSERMAEIIKQAQELSELTGKPMKFFIDIAVQGSFPVPPGTTGASQKPRRQGGAAPEEMATGGQLGNGWTMVGEQGFELVSPSGWVFTNEASKELMKSGMLPEFQMAYGGDLYSSGGGVTAGSNGLTQSTDYKPPKTPKPPGTPGNKGGSTSGSSSTGPTGPSGSSVTAELNSAADSIEASVTTSSAAAAQAAQTSAQVQQTMLNSALATTTAITQGNENIVAEQQRTNQLLQGLTTSLPGQMVAAFVQANP